MENSSIHCFNPGDCMHIGNVVSLKNAMTTLLEESRRVKIDCSNVQKIDTIGVQLIVAFFNEAKKRKLSIESVLFSDAAKSAMERINLNWKKIDESVEGGK